MSLTRSLVLAVLTVLVTDYALPKVWDKYHLHGSTASRFATISGVEILVYALYSIFIYPFYFSPLRHLPEPADPEGRFPWAHAWYIRTEPNGVSFRRWASETPNGGLIRLRLLFNTERLLVTSPSALKEILVTKSYDFTKPPSLSSVFARVIGDGLLSAEGDAHARQRKLLMPAFAFRHIKDLYPIFWSKAIHSTQAIAKSVHPVEGSEKSRSAIENAYDWASRVTLDIIGSAGMGHDFRAIDDPKGEAISTYRELFHEEPVFFYWQYIGLTWVPFGMLFSLPIPFIQKTLRQAAETKAIGARLIAKKKARLAKGQLDDVDILSVALESGGFTEDELANQMMTFLAAGHETSSASLTWATYLLCKHPEIQERLRQEIRSVIPSRYDDGQQITSTMIDRMPYLNAVCSEVFRFMPSVPSAHREAVRDTSIEGQYIPKGTKFFISAWATNVSTEFWGPDAETFNPDRWISDGRFNPTGGAKTNFATLTFLHGPRSCIGKDFARAEFLCLLAAWIGTFRVSLADPSYERDMEGYVTVRPRNGLSVRFEKIDGW